MNAVTRWDPYRELATMRQMMDRFFDQDGGRFPQLWDQQGSTYNLALDVAENQDAYIVKASLPGMNPEDVDITLADNVLTIKGEVKQDKEIKEENYHIRERLSGTFMRSITLPTAVNPDAIEAVNENGVLTLTLPKTEAVKPRRIEVKKMVNGQQ